jgi:acyl-[acyl-carrier-protein]-phospholipid O-acyltransferase/long-chain-fatty-acid--[acyl-carrier-protein] ligase
MDPATMPSTSYPTTQASPFSASPAFMPLFWVQFLGAFNDNLFKNALVMLITFQLSLSSDETGLYITLAAGVFILPFFLFSSFAGQIADRYPKSLLIRKIKLAEIWIMLTGTIGLLSADLLWLFASLFLMGTQSAFFGPIKYSVLPELLPKPALLSGNSWFSGSTFIAILLGTLAGGLVVLTEHGTRWIAAAVVLCALLGYWASLKLPQLSAQAPGLEVDRNPARSTWRVIREGVKHSHAFFAVLAISWFWFIGAVLLSQIPAWVKYTLRADETVVVAFLTLFSVGIALGAAGISRILRGRVVLRFHPLLLVMMSALLLLSVWTVDSVTQAAWQATVQAKPVLMTLAAFVTQWPQNLSLLFLFALAIAGGAYIVPLYTQLQLKTPSASRARMVAVNNILNALLMVLSSLLLMAGYLFALTLPAMLLMMAGLNLLVAGWFF